MDLISAREAFDLGLKRYFTGVSCKHGHIAERMVANGCCVACLNARRGRNRAKNYAGVKAWRKANPGARAAQAARYRAKYPEKEKENKLRYRAKNIEKLRERDRDAKRRIRSTNPDAERARTEAWRERREEKLAAIAGRRRPDHCDICGGNAGGIVFDHCHSKGHFRGWLCDRCNKVLGLIYDDRDLLRSMANYLEITDGRADLKAAEEAA